MHVEYIEPVINANSLIPAYESAIMNVCDRANRDFGIKAVVYDQRVTADNIRFLEQALRDDYANVAIICFSNVTITFDAMQELSNLLATKNSAIAKLFGLRFVNVRSEFSMIDLVKGLMKNKSIRFVDFNDLKLFANDINVLCQSIEQRKTANTTPCNQQLYDAYINFEHTDEAGKAHNRAKASHLCQGMLLALYSNDAKAEAEFKKVMHEHADPINFCSNHEIWISTAMARWSQVHAANVAEAAKVVKPLPLVTRYKCQLLAAAVAVTAVAIPVVANLLSAPRNTAG